MGLPILNMNPPIYPCPPAQTLKRNYRLLKLRPETDFDRILLETVGFSKKEIVKETETEKGEPFTSNAK